MSRQLARLLAGFTGPVPVILDMLRRNDAVYVAPIEEVILDEWSRGSVLLIGDAAHATSPNMAQGAAMALEDGLVLAECLASRRGGRGHSGEIPGSPAPSYAMGPRSDAPPGSHPQPATSPPEPGTAQIGAKPLPRQLPPASRPPLMARRP